MDWTAGYRCRPRLMRVNPDTWREDGRLADVVSASVSRTRSADVPLLEQGSVTLEVPGGTAFEEGWHRIVVDVTQRGATSRFDIATLLLQRAGRTYERRASTVTVSGVSVLKPANQRKMPRGSYAPRGVDGAAYAGRLIAACTPAPVSVEGSFTLSDHVAFESGCDYLKAAWMVLDAGGFCIQLDGDGTVNIRPLPEEPSLVLNRETAHVLVPGVADDLNLADVPNRYYAIDGGSIAIATNENPDSPVSYPSRGRWVDFVDSSPVRVNGESLDAYARRKLAEASRPICKKTYTREYLPGIVPFSVIGGQVPELGLDGRMAVISQSIAIGNGITVSETSGMEVVA